MNTKTEFAKLYAEDEVAERNAKTAQKALNKFVLGKLLPLHRAGRSVLNKELGTEAAASASVFDVGENYAWLLQGVDNIKIFKDHFEVSGYNLYARETVVSKVPNSVLYLSDRDYSKRVRENIKIRREDARDREVTLARRKLDAARVDFEAAEEEFNKALKKRSE